MSNDFTSGQDRGDDFGIDAQQAQQSSEEIHIDTGPVEDEIEIDKHKLTDMMMRLEGEQSFAMGLIGGVGGALVGAVAWALITAITGYQIGFMAIGVGFLVGYAVRHFGKGMSDVFGYMGAVLALLGCLMGNVLSGSFMLAFEEGVPLPQAVLLAFNPFFAIEVLKVMFSFMDLLFYGIAIYEGYRFSFRQITDEELMSTVKTP